MADAADRYAPPAQALPDATADAERVARFALEEDGAVDVTTEITITPGQSGAGAVEFRSGGIVAGSVYAEAVARAVGGLSVAWLASDGDVVPPSTVIATIEGPIRCILRAERSLLNLLQRACGIATATRAFVDALAGTRCRVLHTRKTAPGLRGLDVRAVLTGGGLLHRIDLSQAVLVKDNHWRALERDGRSLAAALDAARARGVPSCYVEVASLRQVKAACAARATRILVDNQPPETLRRWAQVARRLAPGIEVEATGGITLATVRRYATAGADFVSVGALTHSVHASDLALQLRI